MSLFAACLRLVGLSQVEAADFLGVRLDTVKSWSSGRRKAPIGAFRELSALYLDQLDAAEAGAIDRIEWPSDGARLASEAMAYIGHDSNILNDND